MVRMGDDYAGCLQLAGWPDMVRKKLKAGEDVMLMDPMCGSGTFLIEGVRFCQTLPLSVP